MQRKLDWHKTISMVLLTCCQDTWCKTPEMTSIASCASASHCLNDKFGNSILMVCACCFQRGLRRSLRTDGCPWCFPWVSWTSHQRPSPHHFQRNLHLDSFEMEDYSVAGWISKTHFGATRLMPWIHSSKLRVIAPAIITRDESIMVGRECVPLKKKISCASPVGTY